MKTTSTKHSRLRGRRRAPRLLVERLESRRLLVVIAADDMFTTPEDVPYVSPDPEEGLAEILENDDLSGQVGSLGVYSEIRARDVQSRATAGTVTMRSGGSFVYAPEPNYNGTAEFEYTIYDDDGSSRAKVTIVVESVEDPPVAVDDLYMIPSGAAGESFTTVPKPFRTLIPSGGEWDFLDVLENENGASHDYPIDTDEGSSWNDPDFDPAYSDVGPWKFGPTPFESGGINVFFGQLTTPVFGIDSAPDGSNLVTTYLFRTEFNTTFPVATMDGTALCDDACIFYIDGIEVLRLGELLDPVTTLTLATWTSGEDNYVDFTIDTSFLEAGDHTFAVELHNLSLNSADIGLDLELVAQQAHPGLLVNDTDAEDDHDELRVIAILNGPRHGVLDAWHPDGGFTYTPAEGFVGVDTFDYQVQDTWGNVATGTATFHVAGDDDQPMRVTSVEVNANQVDPPALPGTELPRNDQGAPIGWANQNADIQTIDISFDREVSPAVGPDDFVLTNLGVDAAADPDVVVPLGPEQVIVSGSTVTLEFRGTSIDPPIRKLADGVYELEILPSVIAASGQALDGPVVVTGDAGNGLARLDGEFNGDGGTSIFDFSVLAYWFGHPVGTAPAYVDLNRDAGISIFDFVEFASAFGTSLVFASPPVAAAWIPGETDFPPRESDDESDAELLPSETRLAEGPPVAGDRFAEPRSDAREPMLREDPEEWDLADVLADDLVSNWCANGL